MAAKFGTSGLRGLAEELIGKTTRQYVTAFARTLLASGRIHFGDSVFVGQDFRASSPVIVGDVIAALDQQSLKVKLAGTVPTQALALMAMDQNSAAIMVTGSHIPGDRNGIKFYRPDGEIDKPDELAINHLAGLIATHPKSANSVTDDISSRTQEFFIKHYAKLLPPKTLNGMSIGVYQHSTVARDLLVEILESFGAKVDALGRSETFIPVDTEAVSEETKTLLKQWSVSGKYHAIVSADGDGDRPLVTDETGEVLRGDLLGLLAARFLKAKVIATPVTTNSSLEKLSSAKIIRTRVGSPFVIAAMNEALAHHQSDVVGFEANGGFLVGSDFPKLKALPTRDSVLPILTALSTARSLNLSMSDLPKHFPMVAALSDRLENYAIEKSKALMAKLSTSDHVLGEFLQSLGKVNAINQTDGLRATLDDGSIIHLRPSGNAPEFRCYVEAATDEKAARLLEQTLQLLKNV